MGSTIVAVAVPAIIKDLGLSTTEVQWIQEIYTLVFAALWLISARAVQGIGGSMFLPTTLSLLNANFRGKERTIAFAVWGSTIGGMAALGPIVGGWLTSSFSWNWAFLINVPLGLVAVGGVVYFVLSPVMQPSGSLTIILVRSCPWWALARWSLI
ncbi:hypothetical protein AS189_18570 [Arthrobacter alpinus]|uniref:Major facilitator superfamily (MFS) profile domain-containing protein n=1 Tax=Arthrobacter alpinus TaxID=656366 RepID=A0A0S2M3C1_9MICC|nr:MFS transporter [Arthrobacter alpinus]ALO68132.1 hypothetical protein AS189_18570 [Arthrobacter alpinus]